jgi:hypothetical protein
MFLLDSILLAPLKGVIWIGQKLNDVAQREIWDEGHVKEELMQLQLQFELDEISEQEYNKKEEELLAKLDAIAKANEKET